MAEKIVSPGVFTRENDLSFLAQGIGEIGAAVIGPFHKGPAFVPTVVNTQSEFEKIFGTPDGTYYTGYTVQNYLREAGTVTIVRVGHTGGYTHVDPVAIKVQASGSGAIKVVGSLFVTHNGDESVGLPSTTIDAQPSASAFSISGSALGTAVSASILPSAANDLSDVFGESARGSKNAYSYVYFEKAATDLASTLTAGGEVILETLPDQDFGYDIQHATTPWIKSQLISGERHDLFRFHTLGDGSNYNKEYKIGIFNVKAAGESNATDYATFSIVVRGYSDTDKRPSILETFNNVNLDPASPNYIKKVIGDINITIDANGKQTLNGDYRNRSSYIRVECSNEGSFPIIAGPFGHAEYQNPILVASGSEVPAVVFQTDSDSNTASNGTSYSGIDLETSVTKIDNAHYLKPIPTNAGTGSNVVFAFDSQLSYELTGSSAADINKRQLIVGFQGGFDGVSPTVSSDKGTDISSGNSQGFDLASSTSSGSVSYVKAINSVSNPDDFDINLVSAPGIVRQHHSYVFDKIVDMCEAREDAFFIGDVVGADATITDAVD
jgi:hypothetical protein